MNSLESRSNTIVYLTKQKNTIERTIDLIGKISLHKNIILKIWDYHITYGKESEFHIFGGDVTHIVCPIFFNRTSLRCQIIAHEHITTYFKKRKSNSRETYIRSIKYDLINSCENIDLDNIPLYYSWKFLSNNFIREYIGS
jgi:hypothetical protein